MDFCRSSDDLFYGAATNDMQPDWIDLTNDEVAIRRTSMLANLIITMNSDKNLLPRFWYFPHGYQAVAVMTGDDHGGVNGNIASRFDQHIAFSPTNGSVADWEAIRSTSYTFTNSGLINAQAAFYNAAGFEICLHLNTQCANYTRRAVSRGVFCGTTRSVLRQVPSAVDDASNPLAAWSDYTTTPEVEVLYGIRLDLKLLLLPLPTGWRTGLGFSPGSGMPHAFATATGGVIDVYQAATEMTDESCQTSTRWIFCWTGHGYYGAFVANAHTDSSSGPEADAIVWSAIDREVPVISARQLLRRSQCFLPQIYPLE